MSKVQSVTISVTWRPRRFPLRWAWTPDDVPAWDMSRGVRRVTGSVAPQVQYILGKHLIVAHDLGVLRPSGLTFVGDDGGYTADYEDFLDLPPEWQVKVLSEIQEAEAWAWSPGVVDITDEPQTNIVGIDPFKNLWKFPRLVRAWPGSSRRVLPVPDVDSPRVSSKPETWPPTKPLYKSILSLEKTARLQYSPQGLKPFMDSILKIAENYSLLDTANGDSLKDWCDFYTEVVYLDEIRRQIFANADIDDKQIWLQRYNGVEFESNVIKRTERRCWPGAVTWLTQGNPARYWVMAGGSLQALRKDVAESCRSRGLRGDVKWAPWGVGLDVGAKQWSLVELSEAFGHNDIKRCVVCSNPVEGREHTLTCSSRCRQIKSRNAERFSATSSAG